MTEVAKAYGGALYELSTETNTSKEMLEELEVLRQSFEENPKFAKLLTTPTIKKEERLTILDECFRGKVQQHILNFLKILTENGTVAQFPNCVKEFRARYNHDNNIEEAIVVTAVPLSSELTAKLTNKLETITGKTILLTCKVDPSVLGGVRLEMDGVQLEGSVKHRLDALRQSLLHVVA